AELSQPRRAGMEERFVGLVPDVLAGVAAEDVRTAFVGACTPRPVPRVDMDHVAPIRARVPDGVDELVGVPPRAGGTKVPRAHGRAWVERFVGRSPAALAAAAAEDARTAFVGACTPRPVPRVDMAHVAPIRASVQDAVDELVGELPRAGVTTFRRLTGRVAE